VLQSVAREGALLPQAGPAVPESNFRQREVKHLMALSSNLMTDWPGDSLIHSVDHEASYEGSLHWQSSGALSHAFDTVFSAQERPHR
jgi:hypothetical protein